MNTGALKLLFNFMGLGLALLLALGISMRGAPDDLLYWHLNNGRTLSDQGNLPKLDEASYSQGSNLPFNREAWAFSLLAFQGFHLGGIKGLQAAHAASLLACFLLLLATGFRRQARPFSSAIFALAVLAAVSPTLSWPQAWTLALFSACLFLMEGPFWAAFFGRWIWLPMLCVLWVNLDSAALLLLPVAWIWAFAERPEPGDEAPRFPLVAKASVLAILSACLFLHPAGWKLLTQSVPWTPASPFSPEYFKGLQFPLGLLALALVLLVASSWQAAGRRHLGRDAWLLLFFALGSLIWKGLLPFACVWAAPMLASRADLLVDALPGPLKAGRWVLKLGLFALALGVLPRFLAGMGAHAPRSRPFQTLAFFREQGLDGLVFTEKRWSGRALWELAPEIRVFAHAGMPPRIRARASREEDRILAAAPPEQGSSEAAWERLLERDHSDFVLLGLNTPLAKAMARSAFWQPVDFDDESVLYARVKSGHMDLIKTFAPRGLRPGDLDEPFEASRLPQVEADLESRLLKKPGLGVLCYFEAMLWTRRDKPLLARQWLEKGVREDPDFAPNYRMLGQLRLQAGDVEAARRFTKRAAALESR